MKRYFMTLSITAALVLGIVSPSYGDIIIRPKVPQIKYVMTEPATNLRATEITATSVVLCWEDNSTTTQGYIIDRKDGSRDYAKIDWVPEDSTTVTDTGLKPDTTYWYRVKQLNGDYYCCSNELEVTTLPQTPNISKPSAKGPKSVNIQLFINRPECYVNGVQTVLDQTPLIYADRALVPVGFIAEALGVPINWDAAEGKVTIDGVKKIELWINNSYAKVNGVEIIIDPSDYNVKPIVVESTGRTMLPVRFIAETLGCQVDWNNGQITVIYPNPNLPLVP